MHWHGNTSGNTTPRANAALYSFRSPLCASIPTDSNASGSAFGLDSVRSDLLSHVFSGLDAPKVPTPTRADATPEALHSSWWQLQTDMEGVTIGGSPLSGEDFLHWSGADVDMSFLEGAGCLP